MNNPIYTGINAINESKKEISNCFNQLAVIGRVLNDNDISDNKKLEIIERVFDAQSDIIDKYSKSFGS